jgi:chemotaxis signal transduction protein
MSDTELLATSTPAWVLSPNRDFKIAVGESFMVEYVRDSLLHDIPGAFSYCNQVLLWRDNFVPVVDINLVLGDAPIGDSHIAILVYQEYAGQLPQHVAIKVVGEVERVAVSDDTACDWSEDYPLEIQPIIESLFMHQDELVSVISVSDLCNEGYRDYLAQLEEIKVGLD